MKSTLIAATLAFATTAAVATGAARAEPTTWAFDASHSQIVFSYDHLGFSTTYGMFSGFEGEITFDAEDPASSGVTVAFPVTTMLTGWEERFAHFMSDDFFNAAEHEMVRFVSTGIEVTGDESARITGDLTMNGITRPVTLDARLNAMADHPMENRPWAGFDATTSVLRSDFDMGAFAPFVSDEVAITISIEAFQVD